MVDGDRSVRTTSVLGKQLLFVKCSVWSKFAITKRPFKFRSPHNYNYQIIITTEAYRPVFNEVKLLAFVSFFSYGRTRHLPDFGLATSPFLLDDVICQREDGTVPDTIADCRHAGWGDTDCTNDQIARVRCGEPGMDDEN